MKDQLPSTLVTDIINYHASIQGPSDDESFRTISLGNLLEMTKLMIEKGHLKLSETVPPVKDDPGDYVLGRGRVYIDGAYIGNTPQVTFFYEEGELKIAVTCGAMSKNVLGKVTAGPREGALLRYVSCNPIGRSTSFTAEDGKLVVEPFDLKTDDWMTAKFIFSDFQFAWDHQLEEGGE